MSMGVGDSSDLIHGGESSLRVFWLSRTDFEKKLLVVVGVLSVAVVGLLVGIGVLAGRSAAVTETSPSEVSTQHADAHLSTPTPTVKPASTSTLKQAARHHHTPPHSATPLYTHPPTHTAAPSYTHSPTHTGTASYTHPPPHTATYPPTLTATPPPILASRTRRTSPHTHPQSASRPHPTAPRATHSPTHNNATLDVILKYLKLT